MQEGDAHAQAVCPICEAKTGSCSHLLAQFDVSLGEMLGGKFFRHEGKAFEALNIVVKRLLKSIRHESKENAESLLISIEIPRLSNLVRAANEEIADGLDDEGTTMCYADFLDYLDDLYQDLASVVTTQHEIEGDHGASSLCESYWCEDSGACVEAALQQIDEDEVALRRLTDSSRQAGYANGCD